MMGSQKNSGNSGDFFGPVICGLWAGGVCYLSGMRGFFAMDQSIVWDGAWRILQGQVPFRDFVLPYAPLSLWIQAAAFGFLGVSYRVYVLTAAVMNVAGALVAYATFRILVPEKKWPAWTAGILAGSWLYAPMGTTYAEQTGFLAIWFALFALLRGVDLAGGSRVAHLMFAGLASAAAILAKTNAGVLALPCLFLMPVTLRKSTGKEIARDWLCLTLGCLVGLLFFYLWLITCSDPAAFQRYVLEVAGQEGRRRIFENKDFSSILGSLLTGKGNDLIRLLTVSAYVLMAMAVALAWGPWKQTRGAERIRRLGFLGILWAGYQQGFGLTSNNNGINEQPFLALILVSVACVVQTMAEVTSPNHRRASLASFFKAAAFLWLGVALIFTAQQFFAGNRGMGNYDFLVGVALALGLFAWVIFSPHPRGLRPGRLAWVAGLFLGVPFVIGTWGSYFRQAQDFFNFQTRYEVHGDIPMLRGLAWAEGVDHEAVCKHPTWPEFVETWRFLKQTPGTFLLWGHYSLLYATTGKVSPGYLLWLHRGLTYPSQYDPGLDHRMARLVDDPAVSYFVTEDDFGFEKWPGVLPQMEHRLMNKYQLEKKIGPFRLYRRNEKEAR